MNLNLESIIVLLFLIDSIGAVLFAYTSGNKWWQKHFRLLSRYFPLTTAWPLLYLVVVLIFTWLLYRNGIIFMG